MHMVWGLALASYHHVIKVSSRNLVSCSFSCASLCCPPTPLAPNNSSELPRALRHLLITPLPFLPCPLACPLLAAEEVGGWEKLAGLFWGFLEGFSPFLSLNETGPSLRFFTGGAITQPQPPMK